MSTICLRLHTPTFFYEEPRKTLSYITGENVVCWEDGKHMMLSTFLTIFFFFSFDGLFSSDN